MSGRSGSITGGTSGLEPPKRRSSLLGGILSGSSGAAGSNTIQQASQSSSLSEQQMRDLRQIFDWLDYNGNGDISASELLVALKALTPSATLAQSEELIREATGSSKTSLGWIEFCRVIEKGLHKGQGSTAAQMFELVRSHRSISLFACLARLLRMQHTLRVRVRVRVRVRERVRPQVLMVTLTVHAACPSMLPQLDTAGSGQLGPTVLRAALRQWGCDADDHTLDKMVRFIDVDGDGQVSLQVSLSMNRSSTH